MILAEITWAQLGEVAVALAASGGFVIALVMINRKTVTKIDQEPPPQFRRAPVRYNHDLAEQRYSDHERRLDGHDAEIEQLWHTMRAEDARAMATISANHSEVMRALGRIEGELKES